MLFCRLKTKKGYKLEKGKKPVLPDVPSSGDLSSAKLNSEDKWMALIQNLKSNFDLGLQEEKDE